MSAIQSAIESGHPEQLLDACRQHPGQVNQPIAWGPFGKNKTLAVSYLCDRVFEHHMSESTALTMLDILMDNGANLNPPELPGRDTPLITACSLYTDKIALRMIELDADIYPAGTHGGTALHWACWTGAAPVVKALIDCGAELEQLDTDFGSTPLFWAANGAIQERQRNDRQQAACIRLLRKAGAQVDTPSAEGLKAVDMVDPVKFPDVFAALTE